MATFLDFPAPPGSPQIFSFHKCSSKDDMTHLSGATVSNSFTLPEVYLETADSSPNMYSRPTANSERSSYASTTKSHLRQSNHHLYETLQNIQTELAAYRSIMLDIQSRVSHLEHTKATTSHNKHIRKRSQTIRTANMTRESQAWWEACQNFAANCDTPFNANEFLKTTRRLSGFDFALDPARGKLHTPPPDVDDVPCLTPASDREEHADVKTQDDLKHVCSHEDLQARTSASDPKPTNDNIINKNNSSNSEKSSDILKRILSFSKLKTLSPPPPPPRSLRSKSSSVRSVSEEDITALPEMTLAAALALPVPEVTESPQRSYKSIKRVFTYRALLRGRVGSE